MSDNLNEHGIDLEAELAAILRQEIMLELAKENGCTPEEMQHRIDMEMIESIRKVYNSMQSGSGNTAVEDLPPVTAQEQS